MLKLRLVLFLSLTATVLWGQKDNTVSSLNAYVAFCNESIHGMLIAHRLFENYNQDINKYVDLPGHQLNYYNNQDLPQDIFDDPDHWFYEVSPSELFQKSLSNSGQLSPGTFSSLQKTLQYIRGTTLESNHLRLYIGESINNWDLSQQDSLYRIYELLETAVDAYDLLNAQLLSLESQMQSIYPDDPSRNGNGFEKLSRILIDIHLHSRNILQSIRVEDKVELRKQLPELEKSKKALQAFSIRSAGGFASSVYVRSRKRILDNSSMVIQEAKNYLNEVLIPNEYALYGPSYYYYNTQVINKFNRYGNGMVQAINQLIDLLNLPLVHRLELPHYLSIIYPQKVEKQIPVIQSSQKIVRETPKTLENRTVFTLEEKHIIYVDGEEPELEIFDHLKQDGDIISLNFNGDWIFENLSLERKPRKFILKLNKSGKNYLILHAINEGSVPPNTIGINYTNNGRKKRQLLQSNLKTSQLVEIKMRE